MDDPSPACQASVHFPVPPGGVRGQPPPEGHGKHLAPSLLLQSSPSWAYNWFAPKPLLFSSQDPQMMPSDLTWGCHFGTAITHVVLRLPGTGWLLKPCCSHSAAEIHHVAQHRATILSQLPFCQWHKPWDPSVPGDYLAAETLPSCSPASFSRELIYSWYIWYKDM